MMRYGDGGGVDQQERVRREQVRQRAAELFAAGVPAIEVAGRLEVSTKSAYRWRRAWVAGGPRALASRGASGPDPKLSDAQLARLRERLEFWAGGGPGLELAGVHRTVVPGEERVGALLGSAVGALGEPWLPWLVGDGDQTVLQLLDVAVLQLKVAILDRVADHGPGHAVGLQLLFIVYWYCAPSRTWMPCAYSWPSR